MLSLKMQAYRWLGTYAISRVMSEGPGVCHKRDLHMYRDDGLSVRARSRLIPQQAYGGSENPKGWLSEHRPQIGIHRSDHQPLQLGERGHVPARREAYTMDRQRRRPLRGFGPAWQGERQENCV